MCYNGNGDQKSAWRPHAVGDISTHDAIPKAGYIRVIANVNDLRGAHYYYRSIEDSEKKSRDWGKPDPMQGALKVQSYWNSIYDTTMWKYVPVLLVRLAHLLSPVQSSQTPPP